MRCFCPALFIAISCLADGATQTDWSGGYMPAYPYPVWTTSFAEEFRVDWRVSPGNLPLPFQPPEWLIDQEFGAHGTCTHDFDNDGDIDVAAGVYGDDGLLRWYENADGTGTSWVTHTADPLVYHIHQLDSDDFDCDGDEDLCAAQFWYSGAGYVTWWRNNGSTWTKYTIEALGGAISVYAADFDGDGDPDIAAASDIAGMIWYENTSGSGATWQKHFVDSDISGANFVIAHDMDADGDQDLAGSAYYDDCISWWENQDGVGGSWIEHTVVPSGGANPHNIWVSDLDGDGDPDIVQTGIAPRCLAWWENTDGSGTAWEQHVIVASLFYAESAGTADCDGDGDLDITASTGDEVAWWENLDGAGNSWQMNVVDHTMESAYCVRTDDLNGDDNIDLIASSGICGDLCWWDVSEPSCYPSYGWLESGLLYSGGDPDWTMFNWSASTPAGTSACFQVRASDDYQNMGPWSDTLFTAPAYLEGILADNASVFQYRVILLSDDPSVTPTLYSIIITWDLLGTGEGGMPAAFELLPPPQNPVGGMVSATFSLPGPALVEIELFDVSGRLVSGVPPAEYQAGWHSVQMGDPGPGVYFIRMRAGEAQAVQRVVAI